MSVRDQFEQALLAERVANRSGRVAMEHDSPEALAKYLKEYPGADKAKHTVKKPGPAKAPKKDKTPNPKDDLDKKLSKASPHQHRDKAMDAEKAGRHDEAALHYETSAAIFKHRGDHAAAKSMNDAATAAAKRHAKKQKK